MQTSRVLPFTYKRFSLLKSTLLASFFFAMVSAVLPAQGALVAGGGMSELGDLLTINAVTHNNGQATGQLVYRNSAGGMMHAKVQSLRVVNNVAYVGSFITQSNGGQGTSPVGWVLFLRITDSATGPDLISAPLAVDPSIGAKPSDVQIPSWPNIFGFLSPTNAQLVAGALRVTD